MEAPMNSPAATPNTAMATDHPAVRALQPTALWGYFCDLNRVPRASKREAQVTEFAANFGRQRGLETLVDSVGNVIIRKAATPDRQGRPGVILQAHLDMVHQKNQDTEFDFASEGIRMEVRPDWVWAQGTTLGADNGIGVAAIFAILAADDLSHPDLEALLTIDEETGMTGAKALQPGLLRGQVLLNLDTEEDDELTIGCAGGVDVTATGTYTPEPLVGDTQVQKWQIRGLKGGHSGMDIHLGRGNANQLLVRALVAAQTAFGLRVLHIDGGSLRNAIPREATAVVALPTAHIAACQAWFSDLAATLATEYQDTDPDLALTASNLPAATPPQALPPAFQRQLLAALSACPNGVARMSPRMPGLVETSNNLARVIVLDGQWQIGCLTRSSIDTARDHLAQAIRGLWETIGGTVTTSGDYPGWQPQPDASIVQLTAQVYEELFGHPPKVAACHGGLECGILGSKYPHVPMVSFGPNIRGAHSPEERVQISSVQKSWRLLLEVLRRI